MRSVARSWMLCVLLVSTACSRMTTSTDDLIIAQGDTRNGALAEDGDAAVPGDGLDDTLADAGADSLLADPLVDSGANPAPPVVTPEDAGAPEADAGSTSDDDGDDNGGGGINIPIIGQIPIPGFP